MEKEKKKIIIILYFCNWILSTKFWFWAPSWWSPGKNWLISSFRIWPLNDLGTQNENLYHDPQGKLILPPYQSWWMWPLDGRWPASWSAGKTDPITQVWKLDLWMIFDPPKLWSPSSPKENGSHHQSFSIWPVDDFWPQHGEFRRDPRENWYHHQSFRTWPLQVIFDPKMVTHTHIMIPRETWCYHQK